MAKQNPQYWLMKTEPITYSIDDLRRQGKTRWDGVRNFQARNYMRDQMRVGDWALIYHSSIKVPAIVGLAKVSAEAIPDVTQFDSKSHYFDQKSTKIKPFWWAIEVKFVKKFSTELPLRDLQKNINLKGMALLKKGSRLSIQSVRLEEFETILRMVSQTKKL